MDRGLEAAVAQAAIVALVGHLEGLGITTAAVFGRVLHSSADELAAHPPLMEGVRLFAQRLAGGLPPALTAIEGGKDN